MKTKLIVNADDFGLDEHINQGIIRAFSQGLVTSTTVLANGESFLSGIEQLRDKPELGVGVHLTLVNGSPISAPEKVPTLLTERGEFFQDYQQFFARFLSGRISLKEIKEEWLAQIIAVSRQGLEISHLDSHQHLHIFPGIIDVVLDLAQEFKINKIRFPKEGMFFLGGGLPSWSRYFSRNLLSMIAVLSKRKLKKSKIIITDSFYGMLWGGNLRQDKLNSILQFLPPGTAEIMVHPGQNNTSLAGKFNWGYHWEEELQSLTSLKAKQILREKGIKLISYRELNNE